jgi:hypothetical protein
MCTPADLAYQGCIGSLRGDATAQLHSLKLQGRMYHLKVRFVRGGLGSGPRTFLSEHMECEVLAAPKLFPEIQGGYNTTKLILKHALPISRLVCYCLVRHKECNILLSWASTASSVVLGHYERVSRK